MEPYSPSSPKWTDEQILESIRAYSKNTGQPPRRVDWKRSNNDHPSASTVELRFGNWSRAIAQSGFSAPRRGPRGPRWTKSKILLSIKQHHETTGRPPTHRDWLSSSATHPSSATVINRFKGFAKAVQEAGLEPLIRFSA